MRSINGWFAAVLLCASGVLWAQPEPPTGTCRARESGGQTIETVTVAGQVKPAKQLDSRRSVIEHRYDENGNLASTRYPDGTLDLFWRDENSRARRLRVALDGTTMECL